MCSNTAGALAASKRVGMTTTRPDKYGRYLADVFSKKDEVGGKEAEMQEVVDEGGFVNKAIVEEGYGRWW